MPSLVGLSLEIDKSQQAESEPGAASAHVAARSALTNGQ